MGKRQFILGMTFASFFGAALALLFAYFIGPKEKIYVPGETNNSSVTLAKYNFDSSAFVVPEGLNFIYASKVATPAVVHIRTTYTNTQRKSSPHGSFDQFFKDYFGEEYGKGPQGGVARGAGSGVIISKDGYIATNNHVIDGASEIKVVLGDNRTYDAKIIGTDPTTDLALIKIDEEDLPTMPFGNSNDIQIGEWVLAVGNPFEFRSTVTAGIVSAKGRNINILRRNDRLQIESFIQTDAAVNPGNSGGALVNLKGELVGINTAIATQTGSFSGYSFAVPSTLVKKVIEDLREYGEVQRALLGISIVDVSAELAEREDLSVLKGVFVNEVGDNSAADEAGIVPGDVIIGINDRTVNSVAELQELVAVNRPGDRITVTFMHGTEKMTANAELKSQKGGTEIVVLARSKNDGATFSELSDEEKSIRNIDGGVKVDDISAGKWKDAGITEGFIITEIDKKSVNNLSDLKRIIDTYSDEEGVLVEGINTDGKVKYYGIDW